MRMGTGSASLLLRHGRGIGPQDASKKDCPIFLELRRHCGVSHEVPQGFQGASCVASGKSSIPFELRVRTGDCSPGQAGKEVPNLAMTVASRGFSRAAAPVWGFSRGMTGSSGSLSCGASEVRCPCAWRGGACHCSRVMVGESGLKTR